MCVCVCVCVCMYVCQGDIHLSPEQMLLGNGLGLEVRLVVEAEELLGSPLAPAVLSALVCVYGCVCFCNRVCVRARVLERVCCLLVLDSVTSTPQWILMGRV